MTLQDLGQRESNYNACVVWPAYDREKARRQEFIANKQRQEQERLR